MIVGSSGGRGGPQGPPLFIDFPQIKHTDPRCGKSCGLRISRCHGPACPSHRIPKFVLAEDERYLQLDKALDFSSPKQLQAFLELEVAKCSVRGTFHSSRLQHCYISLRMGV